MTKEQNRKTCRAEKSEDGEKTLIYEKKRLKGRNFNLGGEGRGDKEPQGGPPKTGAIADKGNQKNLPNQGRRPGGEPANGVRGGGGIAEMKRVENKKDRGLGWQHEGGRIRSLNARAGRAGGAPPLEGK